MPSELVVLLDPHGCAAGTADKATVHDGDTPLHLAFSAYLFDADGRLLLTRRAVDKRTFPGLWTNSVCGHPAPDEDLADSVTRRTRQELGLEIDRLRLVLPEFGYRAEMQGVVEHELCPVYAGWVDAPMLSPDPDEVGGTEWVDWDGFSADVLDGARAVSPWCREQLEELVTLGADPRVWPEADAALLPPAARIA